MDIDNELYQELTKQEFDSYYQATLLTKGLSRVAIDVPVFDDLQLVDSNEKLVLQLSCYKQNERVFFKWELVK